MSLTEIVREMIRFAARSEGKRIGCCEANRRIKKMTSTGQLPYSQRMVLRHLCSQSLLGVLDELNLHGYTVILKHTAHGKHGCPCNEPLCQLPFQGFHGVKIVLVASE